MDHYRDYLTIAHRVLTHRDAAAYLDISERTLFSIRQKGEISYIRVGRLIRFYKCDLDDYIWHHRLSRKKGVES